LSAGPGHPGRDVVVTGVGAVTPLGAGAEILLRRWCAGENGFAEGLGRCTDFDPHDHLSRKEARRTDRFTHLALGAADEALEGAGWTEGVPYDPYRVATVIGTGIGGEETFEDQLGVYRTLGAGAVSPLVVPRLMGNAAAAAVAIRYCLRGPSASVATACASGSDAVAAGARLIRTGEVDAAVVGGAESAVSPFAQTAFGVMGAISKSGVCRPFDARRDGFVLSEAAGVLVLEEGDAARRRGAPVIGRVAGAGSSSDAFHITAPEGNGEAIARAMAAALADAAIGPGDVDYVNAHGTGTALNDRSETEALKAVLGERAGEVPVSSTKSAIGHPIGAAGAVEAVVTLLALRDRVAPPTLGYGVPDEGLDLDYVGDGPRALASANGAPRYAVSSSLGFGGHNAVLVLASAGEAEGAPA
jgi:3-oxoacyl-[acyl-carrier-protein] synthase II